METKDNLVPVTDTEKGQPPSFTRKIGKTTYKVEVHFSKTSKETMTDKILRLIGNEVANEDTRKINP